MFIFVYFTFIVLLTRIECFPLWGLDIDSAYEISDFLTAAGHPLDLPQIHTKLRIKNINGTIYKDTFSKLGKIESLEIASNHINQIEAGAICLSPTLRQFQIDFTGNDNNLSFHKNIFDNCEHLEELALIFNYELKPELDVDFFEYVSNLKTLVLRNFKIEHLTKAFITNLKFVSSLTLFNTQMKQIDGNVFEHLNNLEKLSLNLHMLTTLPKDLFKSTPKLTTLILANGNLTGLNWGEFDGLTSLKSLVLTQNHITSFDADKIATYMPELEALAVELNPLECKKLESFAEELTKKFEHPIQVTYKFDPGFYDECKAGIEI
ncbi:hypothetical protein Zmor_016856 [Zophobas morio]|uniref:Uncharacterized protein n=1 Tax=Zophobas morio TaxID=2755281 RepID=A0AA38I8B0_9CUCU|nr:hypothetical protein Zmor_016856 [Zophobas morio]